MIWKKQKTPLKITQEQILRRLAAMELAALEFYKGLYEGSESSRVQELATVMIRAENRHYSRFMKYADLAATSLDTNGYAAPEVLQPEIANRMAVRLLPSADTIRQSARFSADRELIQMAVRAEEKAARLLTDLREFLPDRHRGYITRVINEEWMHKAQLEAFLREQVKAEDLLL